MPFVTRTIWIDQLCIDQANLEERKHQVGMMQHIYQNAATVLIWLGPDDEELASDAKDLILQLSSPFLNDIPERISMVFPSDEDLASCGLPKRSSPQWHGLDRLCTLPYFHRIWVIQETVMASKAVLVWGSVETNWETFKLAIFWLVKNRCMLGSDGLEVEELLIMIADVHPGRRSLEFCLESSRHRQTSDLRDRVFAFLGIAGDVNSFRDEFRELEVDYLKPVESVFADATRYSIRRDQRLDFLNNVYHKAPIVPSNWPTWAPGWKTEDRRSIVQKLEDGAEFTAGADTKVCLQKLSNKNVFVLEGLEVGQVKNTFSLEGSPFYWDAIYAAWSHVSSHLPDPFMDKPLIQAFVNTLTARRVMAPGYPLLTLADDSILVDYTAFLFSELLKYISDDLAVSDIPPAECLKHKFYSAEKALDLYRQLQLEFQNGSKIPSDESCSWFKSVMEYCHKDNKIAAESGAQWMEKLFGSSGNSKRFYGSFLHTGDDRKIFTTSQGQLGLGPYILRAEDIVCVMLGGPTPYALRPIETGGYLFLGECFLYGFMCGEAIKAWNAGKLAVKDFILK
jgi:hypothetical protein